MHPFILNILFYLRLQYADPVSDLLDKWGAFRCRLFRESCVFHRGNYVKDLSRLGRDLNKVIIVDNSPASYVFHPDNAVSIFGQHTQHPSHDGDVFGWDSKFWDYSPAKESLTVTTIAQKICHLFIMLMDFYTFHWTFRLLLYCFSLKV